MTRALKDTFRPLFEMITQIQSVEECEALFDDLCTIREMKDLAQRYEVARLLDQGMNYQEIAAQTGVSSTTISRVRRCLDYGSGGYRMMLERMKERET